MRVRVCVCFVICVWLCVFICMIRVFLFAKMRFGYVLEYRWTMWRFLAIYVVAGIVCLVCVILPICIVFDVS